MRMHFVTIPAFGSEAGEAELNQFITGHRVLSVDRQFIADGPRSAWAVCVLYTEGQEQRPASTTGRKRSVDYRELLSPEDFAVFARLRSLREQLAEKDGVPAYALFTNEQLATMVRQRVRTIVALGAIAGVGKGRIDKYGAAFLAELARVEATEDDDAKT